MIISGVLILVVLGALIAAPRLRNKGEEVLEQEVSQLTETASATTRPALSRAEAQAKYADAKVTFSGAECVVDPKEMKQKNYTTIMLDNDSDVRRTIVVGAKSYSVGPRRYTLSWLNTGAGELAVACDGKEVATITVE